MIYSYLIIVRRDGRIETETEEEPMQIPSITTFAPDSSGSINKEEHKKIFIKGISKVPRMFNFKKTLS